MIDWVGRTLLCSRLKRFSTKLVNKILNTKSFQVCRYVWSSSFQEACTSMVHVGYDYVTPTRPADV